MASCSSLNNALRLSPTLHRVNNRDRSLMVPMSEREFLPKNYMPDSPSDIRHDPTVSHHQYLMPHLDERCPRRFWIVYIFRSIQRCCEGCDRFRQPLNGETLGDSLTQRDEANGGILYSVRVFTLVDMGIGGSASLLSNKTLCQFNLERQFGLLHEFRRNVSRQTGEAGYLAWQSQDDFSFCPTASCFTTL